MTDTEHPLSQLMPSYKDADHAFLKHVQTFVHVIAPFAFEVLKRDYVSVSKCGIWGERFLNDYADYQAGRYKYAGIGSVGIGYSEDTIRELETAGIYIGPAIALTMEMREWGPQSASTAISAHPMQDVRDYFGRVGIRTAFITGGHFPDKVDASGIMFDISDPDFLTKMVPLFMEDFNDRAAARLKQPNHIRTDEEYLQYFYVLFRRIRDFAQAHGVTLKQAGESFGGRDVVVFDGDEKLQEIPERIVSQADYQWDFPKGTLEPMMPVFTLEQRTQIFKQMVDDLAQSDVLRTIFRRQLRQQPATMRQVLT